MKKYNFKNLIDGIIFGAAWIKCCNYFKKKSKKCGCHALVKLLWGQPTSTKVMIMYCPLCFHVFFIMPLGNIACMDRGTWEYYKKNGCSKDVVREIGRKLLGNINEY